MAEPRESGADEVQTGISHMFTARQAEGFKIVILREVLDHDRIDHVVEWTEIEKLKPFA